MTSKEALEKISNGYTSDLLTNEWFEWLQTIKQALEHLETLEKAIEILKQFISLDLECNIIYEIRMGREMIVISQQEYELLKEVLGEW